MNRRSFFQSVARVAGIIALAPQLAFRAPKIDVSPEDSMDEFFGYEFPIKVLSSEPHVGLYDFFMAQK